MAALYLDEMKRFGTVAKWQQPVSLVNSYNYYLVQMFPLSENNIFLIIQFKV